MNRTIEVVLIVSLLSWCGCHEKQSPLELPRYTILESGTPDELHIQPLDTAYSFVVSSWEKGHEVIVLPRGDGDVARFRSKRFRFWVEGNEVKVEVFEQDVVDAGEI